MMGRGREEREEGREEEAEVNGRIRKTEWNMRKGNPERGDERYQSGTGNYWKRWRMTEKRDVGEGKETGGRGKQKVETGVIKEGSVTYWKSLEVTENR